MTPQERAELQGLRDVERAAWNDMCQLLFAAGMITASDLNTPAGQDVTPGCRLLNSIRLWSKLYTELYVVIRQHKDAGT